MLDPSLYPRPAPPYVLHVEDDPDDALLFSLAFRRSRLLVALQFASDGREAVRLVTQGMARGEPLPAAFIIDLKMPGMDGFELLAWRNAQAGLRHIPALVLTSSSFPEDMRKAMNYGASGYFAKSEDFSDVLVALSTCLAGGCVPGLQLTAAQCA